MNLTFAALIVLVESMHGFSSAIAFPWQDATKKHDSVIVMQGLKDRRLFDLAETFANDMLSSETLDQIEKADIVLELIRCKVAEAIALTGSGRANAWSESEQIAKNFAKDFPDHPHQLLVDVQDALGNLTHGSLIQQEINAEIQSAENKPIAIEQFRIATKKFNTIEKQIERQLPLARSRNQSEDELSPQQLVNLKNNVRYRLAIINLAKAELYDPKDRLNQVDALNQVLLRLDEVITQSNSDIPLWWDAQLSRAKCYRLMKESQALTELFENLPAAELSSDLACKLLTEQMLSAISFEQKALWSGLLKRYVEVKNPTAKLQLAALKLLMANSAASISDEQKRKWQSEATQLVNQIEARHGQYWGRRAEILLVGSVETNADAPTTTSDFELLARQGDSALRRKNIAGAIQAYSKAVKLAFHSANSENAMTMSVRLAQCFEQRNRNADAAECLFAAADQFAESLTASSVHLRGCWNLGQVKTAESDKNLIRRLQNQITLWPEDENANQANLWLAGRYQNDRNWKAAVKSYLEVDLGSSKMLSAVPLIESSVEQWIRSVRDDGGDWKTSARQFVEMVQSKAGVNPGVDNESESARKLLLIMLDIGLPGEAIDPAEAEDWLTAAILLHDQAGGPDPRWRQQAMARKAVVLAKQQSNDLQLAIQQLPNDASVLRVCINGIKANLSNPQMASISDSMVTLCNKALADENRANTDFWILEKAKAEVAGGGSENAIGALEELASKNPKSLEIQLAYARALSELAGDQELAIQQWRRLASKVKKGTDAWFESKYNVIKLMKEIGKSDEADKLSKYLQATSPGWKESKWSQK